jgi:hypothetical protein
MSDEIGEDGLRNDERTLADTCDCGSVDHADHLQSCTLLNKAVILLRERLREARIKPTELEAALDTSVPTVHDDGPLYGADFNCEHDIQPARGGGVKCSKCRAWFCH